METDNDNLKTTQSEPSHQDAPQPASDPAQARSMYGESYEGVWLDEEMTPECLKAVMDGLERDANENT